MFSRITSPQGRNQKPSREVVSYDSPLEELTHRLDRLAQIIERTKNAYIESIQPAPNTPPPSRGATLVNSLKRLGRRPNSSSQEDEQQSTLSSHSAGTPVTKSSPMNGRSRTPKSLRKDPEARFISMDREEEVEAVEIIRRVAELVVVGERAAASAAEHTEKLRKVAEKQTWGDDITEEQEEALKMRGRSAETDKYISLFENFFERNGLSFIVQIVTGACFSLNGIGGTSNERAEDMKMAEGFLRGIDTSDHDYSLLPPLPIATQAIQSVSILVQNVSRATSLYFILSNNHINQLIDLPLELYHVAERKKYNQEGNQMSPRRFGSPELAELTTHFVTFLKSLALRMNVETLQFFLTYPSETSLDENGDGKSQTASSANFSSENSDDVVELLEDQPLDEIETNSSVPKAEKEVDVPVAVKEVEVCFPLYARALEFCAAHQDNFVRVTAMNICLNTLRLATVSPDESDGEDGEPGTDLKGSSPDGVLHNAKPLPFAIRLHIAQHVCAPSRVERLVSPIFTKLAQLWGMLEEQFREIDSSLEQRGGLSKGKVARAKEVARRQRLKDSLNDTAASLQDEMLLLEDVLKVGLTSLNEQAIEMMLATFVYPLLLQPLLLYFQRSPVADEILFLDPLNDHSAGRDVKPSDRVANEKSLISAPTKSAIFSISAVFKFITNQPLLRLLFVALLHPLSPDSTSQTMIRAKADVARMGKDGNVTLRVDQFDDDGQITTLSDRSTYVFGAVTGKRCSAGQANSAENSDACVFVLSPSLREILEYRGEKEKVALVARTRHNPYRKAIFNCLCLSRAISDLPGLAVLAIDSAVSVLKEEFVTDILLGLDLKKFADDMPVDERKLDSRFARELDDRGIGGPATIESRQALASPAGGKIGFDYMGEVVSSFRSCVLNVIPVESGTWKLEYNLVAAHAFLCAIRGSPQALKLAAKATDRRCRQAAAFLSDMPAALETAGFSQAAASSNQGSDKSGHLEQQRGLIMDALFYAHGSSHEPLLDQLLEIKRELSLDGSGEYFVAVAREGNYDDLCKRVCVSLAGEDNSETAALDRAIGSARAWVRLDAMSVLLSSSASHDVSAFHGATLGGFAIQKNCAKLSTPDRTSIYSSISDGFRKTVFEEYEMTVHDEPESGSVVSFVGHTAIPCVCEAPPSSAPLFSRGGSKVVAEGITWQSLYLILLGIHLVLAEPEKKSGGEGRVITSCKLERLMVQKDESQSQASSTARRLLMSHSSLDSKPPGLFQTEEGTKEEDMGPFRRVKQVHSSLDIWFEDEAAVSHAFDLINIKIMEAKGRRGKHFKDYLAQGEMSKYSLDRPVD